MVSLSDNPLYFKGFRRRCQLILLLKTPGDSFFSEDAICRAASAICAAFFCGQGMRFCPYPRLLL